MSHTAWIGVGGNIPPRRDRLNRALQMLDAVDGVRVAEAGSWWETEPVAHPSGDQDPGGPFLNAVVRIETDLTPDDLLAVLKGVESRCGRTDRGRWGPREADLDLLLYDDAVRDDEDLRLPHPQVTRRRFVLAPLAEVAPDLTVPGADGPAAALLERCPDTHGVERLDDGPRWR